MKKKITAIVCVLLVVIGFTVVDVMLKKNDKEDKPVVVVEEVTELTVTPEPTEEPVVEEVTPEPTEAPVVEPTVEVTPEPTEEPTPEPTVEVTPEPTAEPVVEVTPEPTKAPEPTPTKKPEPTTKPTPEPTKKPEPNPTAKPEPTPNPTTIIEATEEEMITGKYNTSTTIASNYTWTADYVNYDDKVFNADDSSIITITKDGLKSSGTYKSYVTTTKWKLNYDHKSSFKYGETKWKYTDSTGDNWEDEYVKLTKDITKFGFDFSRFKVNKSETSKDTITIKGTYTLSKTANTLYDMYAVDILATKDVVGNVNKVTANVTITLDNNTKSMSKVVLKYNMNGEIFGTASDAGTLDVAITSYTHTFTFK